MDRKVSTSVGKRFCQLKEVPFITSGNRNCEVGFLTKMLPTNEWTFCWAMSKLKGFLKDWDSSDFSGCFLIISLMCSQLGLGHSLQPKHMQDALANIWRHTTVTKYWLKDYSAFLQRLRISFTRYWNSTAVTSFKYFCRLFNTYQTSELI